MLDRRVASHREIWQSPPVPDKPDKADEAGEVDQADSPAMPAFEEIFAQFGDLFGDMFGPGAGKSENGDLSAVLVLAPHELRAGCTKTIEVRHRGECTACSSTACSACAGRGNSTRTHGFFAVQSSCPRCAGSGRRFDRRCPSCRGSGDVVDRVEVVVPPDSEPRQAIGIDEAGNLSADGERRGHLYVWLDVEGGTGLPQARVHSGVERRSSATTRFALGFAAAIAAAVILSLLF